MRIGAVVLGLWLSVSCLLGQQVLWQQPILTGEAVAYTPNGQLIATLTAGNRVALYQSGQVVGVLDGASGWLQAIAISSDGQFLTAGDDSGRVYLWRLSDRRLLWETDALSGMVQTIAFVGNTLIAVGGEGGLQLRRALDGSLERALVGHPSPVTTVAVAPNGAELVSGDESGQARMWRIADGALLQTWQAQVGTITTLAWSGQTLATGSLLGQIRIWTRSSQGQWMHSRQINAHDGEVSGLAFGANNLLYSAGGIDGQVRLWNSTTGASQGGFAASESGVLSFALRPDGMQICTGVGERVLRLWSTNGTLQGALGGHTDSVIGVGFAATGRVATVSYDQTLRLWNLVNGAPFGTPVSLSEFALAAAIRPDGAQAAVGDSNGRITLHSLPSGAQDRQWSAHTNEILCVAYTPEGNQIVSGSYDGTAKVWNTTGTLVHALNGHSGAVQAIAASSAFIATGDTLGRVRLWNRTTGGQERDWDAHSDICLSLAFSPNGALLATGSQDGTVCIWRVNNGERVWEFRGHEFGATRLLFLSDNWLLTADGVGLVRLYATDTGERVGQWQATSGRIETMAYQAQGGYLAIGGDAGILLLNFGGTPNRPPHPPELLAPADGASITSRTPTFQVRAVDPDAHAVRVEVEIDYAGQRRLLQSAPAPSGSDFTLSVPSSAPLPPRGYTWRARAIDEFGGISDWSAPRTLTIANQSPEPPELLAPEDNATTSAQPTFHVRLTDPDADRCRVVVRISGDGGLERTLESGLVNSDSEAQVSVSQSLPAGVYTWQAKTRDEYGAESDWSAARSFTVQTNRAPNTPELLEPASNATVSPTPTFRARLTDPDADRVKAIVEIAPQSGEPLTIESAFVNSGETAQVSISSSQPLQAGMYRWRARARDNRDALSAWSDWREFQVNSDDGNGDDDNGGDDDGNGDGDNPPSNQPPSKPTLLAPSVNAITSPTPTFRLRASDPDNEQVRFDIEITVGNRQFTFATDFADSGATAIWRVPLAQALPAGAATWRARAIDARGATSVWSSSQPFTLSDALPRQLQGVQTFSLSLDLNKPTLAALGLQDVRVVEWDPAKQQYREVTQLQLGSGYFIRAETPVQPDLSGAPFTGEARLPLQPGWNLISHPYLASQAWDETAIRVERNGERRTLRDAHAAGWVELYAWLWDAQQRSYRLVCDPRTLTGAQSELPPGTAVWILAWQPCELILTPTTRAASGRGFAAPPRGWSLRVQAQLGEFYNEAVIGVGMPLRAVAPPHAPSAESPVQVRLHHLSQNLSADIRSAHERAEWTLQVVVAPADAPRTVELHFPDLMRLPRRSTLALYDMQTQRTLPLRGRARYAFTAPAEGGVFQFRIQPERARMALQILQPLVYGGRSTGGQMTLQVTLTAPAQVQFEIRAAGRTVRRLPVQTTRAPDTVQVLWDGRDDAGRALPPGSYQASIVAQSDEGQVVRATIPILLTR